MFQFGFFPSSQKHYDLQDYVEVGIVFVFFLQHCLNPYLSHPALNGRKATLRLNAIWCQLRTDISNCLSVASPRSQPTGANANEHGAAEHYSS